MKSSMDEDVISKIEAWLRSQCDGDWEHTYGITIETTDNPGWYVQVDLNDTALSEIVIPFSRCERSENDWTQFEVKNSKFIGSGGIGNLNEVLCCFLSVISDSDTS